MWAYTVVEGPLLPVCPMEPLWDQFSVLLPGVSTLLTDPSTSATDAMSDHSMEAIDVSLVRRVMAARVGPAGA